MSEKPAAVTAAQTGQRRSWGARALCAAWLLLAVVLLAAGVWSLWLFVGTDQRAASQARAAVERFDAACSTAGEAGSDSATAAEVVGLLSFPGYDDQSWPVLAGTGSEQLATGIGWYPETAGVGEIGNMVLAGYRITHGAPFAALADLNVGDQIQIVTCTHVYLYELDVAPRDLTVQAHDDWVLDAVPGDPGKRPSGRQITLITSQDLLPTSDRSVGMGHLVSSHPR
ncbi:hypothetical protein SDC9_99926 [bioreactor metagenome]|uniref:Sortase n=1 Tax=bioreactor metagenome TaxID=1076179 RepID=A0A645ALG6_9ZZZZ|nr:class E sortase [Propionibacterium sp.]